MSFCSWKRRVKKYVGSYVGKKKKKKKGNKFIQ
jgi:hypothetical protein